MNLWWSLKSISTLSAAKLRLVIGPGMPVVRGSQTVVCPLWVSASMPGFPDRARRLKDVVSSGAWVWLTVPDTRTADKLRVLLPAGQPGDSFNPGPA